MTEHDLLKARWDEIVKRLSDTFSEGEPLQVDTIIYLIGVQELGKCITYKVGIAIAIGSLKKVRMVIKMNPFREITYLCGY